MMHNSTASTAIVEADRADSLKHFLTQAGITITSDCRNVEAVLRLARGTDLERVAKLLLEWSAEERCGQTAVSGLRAS